MRFTPGNCTQDYKQECLDRWRAARRLLNGFTKSERRMELELHERRHGKDATDLLKAEILRQWRARA